MFKLRREQMEAFRPVVRAQVPHRVLSDLRKQGVPAERDSKTGEISQEAGQGGRISGTYIEAKNTFSSMLDSAQSRVRKNFDPRRQKYDQAFNNCLHFAKDVAAAGGVDMPWVVDPRPKGYLDDMQGRFPNLEYDPRGRVLIIEGHGKF